LTPKIFCVALSAVFLTGCNGLQGGDPMQPEKRADEAALKEQVDRAFEAARNGDFAGVAELEKLGLPVVPLLGPHLADPDPNLRREVVALLQTLGGREALPLLVAALGDHDLDIQQRATMGLYLHRPPVEVAKAADAESRLWESVEAGNQTAAAILLLGYFSGPETGRLLQSLQTRPAEELAELHPWSPAVPVALPATVALSLRGDNEARQRLIATIRRGEPKELEFLLSVLREIDAPEVIHALKQVLKDERPTKAGVPSGGEPELRICDLAVNAFVRELDLKVDFTLAESDRYTPEQIDAVRRAINASVPQ
jgi:HEAT repeat protein